MAVWRFLLLAVLALGSVLPHCATAAPVATAHHVGMTHHDGQPAKAHANDSCIGCATPARLGSIEPVALIASPTIRAVPVTRLATRTAALDPPPPRPAS